MTFPIFVRISRYKNFQAVLVGGVSQINDKNEQYYLEVKRLDLVDDCTLRLLIRGQKSLSDLLDYSSHQPSLCTSSLLKKMQSHPKSACVGTFLQKRQDEKASRSSCSFKSNYDSLDVSFAQSFISDTGIPDEPSFEEANQIVKLHGDPKHVLRLLSQLKNADKEYLFDANSKDWLIPDSKESSMVKNSFLSCCLPVDFLENKIIKDLIKFQSNVITDRMISGLHPGWQADVPLGVELRADFAARAQILANKASYITSVAKRDNDVGRASIDFLNKLIGTAEDAFKETESVLFTTEDYKAFLATKSETLTEDPYLLPVTNIGFNGNGASFLAKSGFFTIKDIAGATEEELLAVKMIGASSIKAIKEYFIKNDLKGNFL